VGLHGRLRRGPINMPLKVPHPPGDPGGGSQALPD
jgi:hypothetical protein